MRSITLIIQGATIVCRQLARSVLSGTFRVYRSHSDAVYVARESKSGTSTTVYMSDGYSKLEWRNRFAIARQYSREQIAGPELISALGALKIIDADEAFKLIENHNWEREYDSQLENIDEAIKLLGLPNDAVDRDRLAADYADKHHPGAGRKRKR